MQAHLPFPSARARALGRALLACLAVAALADGARAQQTRPSVQIVARDGQSLEPVVGAQIHLGDGGPVALTDGSGTATLAGLSARSYVIRVTHLGYEPYTAQVTVQPDGEARHEARLAARAVTLAAVSVQGPARPRSRMLNRFYTRAETGNGAYLTREQIDRMNARRASDLFRVLPGLVVTQNPGGDQRLRVEGNAARLEGTAPGVAPRAKDCPILYFLDGTPIEPMQNGSIDHEIRPSEIEGIEVYRRGTLAPAEFRRTGANCGVVLIWKRERI